MSYGQWRVDEEATLKEFGYYSTDVSDGSKKPLVCRCQVCGIIANKRKREATAKHICKSIIDGKKRCFKCRTFKPVEEFSRNRTTFDKYQKVCKECFAGYECVKVGYFKKSQNLKKDLKTYLRNRTSHLERKCILKNVEFNMTKEFLYEQYIRQEGKCYYTGLPILHNTGCHQYNSISVERLNPDLGYTIENSVLTSFAINSFKGMMTMEEFKQYLIIVIPKLKEFFNI